MQALVMFVSCAQYVIIVMQQIRYVDVCFLKPCICLHIWLFSHFLHTEYLYNLMTSDCKGNSSVSFSVVS